MLADAEHVLTRAPEGSVPADLACHVQALLARVRQVEKERDRCRAALAKHHRLHIMLGQYLDGFPNSAMWRVARECHQAMEEALKESE